MTMETIKQVEAEVLKSDPAITPGDDTHRAAVIILSALQVGADREKVAAFTKYDRDFIDKCADNLEASEVWKDGKTCANLGDEDSGIEFWLLVNVALGFVARSKSQ